MKIIILILLSNCLLNSFAQTAVAQQPIKNDILIADIDFDKINDTVIFDRQQAIITAQLSTQKFAQVKSLEVDIKSNNEGIRAKGNGFEYFQEFMSSGVSSIFLYDKAAKKIRLVAINSYSLGSSRGNEEGKADLNLLTNLFNGSWTYYEEETEQYFNVPVANRKMIFPKTWLETYSNAIVQRYYKEEEKILQIEETKIKEAIAIALYATDSLICKKQFSDALGKHNLQVKVYNPCREQPPFDGALTLIKASLKTGSITIEETFNYPDAQMALISFNPREIYLQKISNKTAVFIPFYLCGGYETYNKQVSYIIFYNNRHYCFEIPYYCKTATECHPVEDINHMLNELPQPLKTTFINYLNKKHRRRDSFEQ